MARRPEYLFVITDKRTGAPVVAFDDHDEMCNWLAQGITPQEISQLTGWRMHNGWKISLPGHKLAEPIPMDLWHYREEGQKIAIRRSIRKHSWE